MCACLIVCVCARARVYVCSYHPPYLPPSLPPSLPPLSPTKRTNTYYTHYPEHSPKAPTRTRFSGRREVFSSWYATTTAAASARAGFVALSFPVQWLCVCVEESECIKEMSVRANLRCANKAEHPCTSYASSEGDQVSSEHV